MSSRMRAVRSWTVLALCIGACADVPESGEPQSEVNDEQAIVYGQPSSAMQDAVVRLSFRDSEGFCTGTLIAPNLVLTAYHCVAIAQIQPWSCDPEGAPIVGGEVEGMRAAGDVIVSTGRLRSNAVAAIGQRIVTPDAKNMCNHDVALIVLDRKLTGKTAAVRLSETTRAGETFTAIGYGRTHTSAAPLLRQQRTGITVRAIGTASATDDVPPNELGATEGVCQGDSGGPALTADNTVIGVVSRGGGAPLNPSNPASACIGESAGNLYTRLAAFAPLIRATAKEAGVTLVER